MNRLMDRIKHALLNLVTSLFEKYGESRFQKSIFICVSFALYLFGLLQWAKFTNYGNITFQAADWYKEYAFYTILQKAVTEGTIPYHVNLSFHGTDRFLAIPEVVLSPQILILYFTENIGTFVLLHFLFLFTIGFIGCLALQRHFRLSSFSFVLLTGLFTFNGYITSHLAVGHTMWGGYFFLPWFFLILVVMTEGQRSVLTSALGMAMVLFLMLLQGSLHIFVGCVVYLVLFTFFNPKYMRVIASSLAGAIILSSYRLFPTVISFSEHNLYFQSGYPTIRDVFDAFTVIKYPSIEMVGGLTGGLYWWELDIFIGLFALAFISYFGVYKAIRSDWGDLKFSEFNYPNLIVAVFSINHFYAMIANLPAPLASVERVPSRFLIIPIVALVIFSCVRLDRYFGQLHGIKNVHWLALLGTLQTYFGLLTHMRFWNVQSVNAALPAIQPLDIAIATVVNDRFYIHSVAYSFLVSVGGLIVWALLVLRARRRS